MIHMPRRSVTRFFIPLIDVLLLLFGIFLLMPMVVEEGTKLEEEKNRTPYERLAARNKELEKENKSLLEKKAPDAAELAKIAELKAELERLRKLMSASAQEKIFVRVLDIDPGTGEVSSYDGTRPEKERVFRITKEETAKYLIEKHKRQAGSRELYYYFVVREDSGFPTVEQRRTLQKWFTGVAHSLGGKETES